MVTTLWQAAFSEFWISFFKEKNHYLFEVNLTFLHRFRVNLLMLIISWSTVAVFEGFRKFEKSKMADPRWQPFENETLLWRHMTSSADAADLNGNIFGLTICPLSFVVIALTFSELRGGGGIRPPPRSHKAKKTPVWIGLNHSYFQTCGRYFDAEKLAACKESIFILPESGLQTAADSKTTCR